MKLFYKPGSYRGKDTPSVGQNVLAGVGHKTSSNRHTVGHRANKRPIETETRKHQK